VIGLISPLLLAEDDVNVGSLIKVLVFLGIVLISVINSAIKKGKAAMAARPRVDAANGADGMRSEVLERERVRDERVVPRPARPSSVIRTAGGKAATAPATTRPPVPPLRRRGLLDDAHVEVAAHLPTSDDMPGAHAAHDHVHLTEIGADRGTAPKHMGAHPEAAASVARRTGASGHALLRSSDLKGRDRVRAGILWAEVFSPPRSRARR
jgi:hypothetical protein